jgi:hypothetical protein
MSDARETTLNYARPAPGRAVNRQRVLYCVGLPLLAFGLGMAHAPGDTFLSACTMSLGALLVAFALPVSRKEAS